MDILWEGLLPIQGDVVVIEDDPMLRDLTVDIVTELGAACTAFDNADDALIHLLQLRGACPLVIADHGVPGSIKGMELAMMIHEKWPAMGVILTSGYLLDTAKLPATVVYLLKPWDIDDLVRTIAQLLQPGVPVRKVGPGASVGR